MFLKRSSLIFAITLWLPLCFFTQEKEISLSAYPDSLYGTLLQANKSNVLCIIHAGSGPTDRNGNSSFAGENNSLLKLAEFLYKNNISSFRYDKRGIGKSKDAMVSEDSMRIESYVNDLNMFIDYFSKKPYKYKKIILIGHSEGALIVTLTAQKTNKVNKIILLAGAGYRADTVIKRQLSFMNENAKKVIFPLFDSLAKGRRIQNVPPLLSMFFRESIQGYMISWFKYDPAVELGKLNISSLIIQGDNDIQIGVKDAERLKQFSKTSELKIIPGMNHILVICPRDKDQNKKTYDQPELPLADVLLQTIVQFIKK